MGQRVEPATLITRLQDHDRRLAAIERSSRLGVSAFSAVDADTVATAETTSSSTYTDLATTGPDVTVTIGGSGRALVLISAGILASETSSGYMSFAVSGASTVAASDTRSVVSLGEPRIRFTRPVIVAGLTAGVTTFTAKYRKDGPGTDPDFADRDIVVWPLA